MIAPSTDFPTFAEAVRSLAATPAYHYRKHPSIVSRTKHDGRTHYSRFARVDRPLDDRSIREHLAGIQTLALPLTHAGKGSAIVFVYDGKSSERFVHLCEHLMRRQGITDYTVFYGRSETIRLLVLPRPRQPIASLYSFARELSEALEAALPRSWKILPDPSFPEGWNILPIPYDINLPSAIITSNQRGGTLDE